MPCIRKSPIEVEELSQHLRRSIGLMNEDELATFTDALATTFLANGDIQRQARFLLSKQAQSTGDNNETQ